MIYDLIPIGESTNFFDIALYTSLEDYQHNKWGALITVNKITRTIDREEWVYSSYGDTLVQVDSKTVPLWCKNLLRHLRPRIVEMAVEASPQTITSFIEPSKVNSLQ